jgi:hypothetical protein
MQKAIKTKIFKIKVLVEIMITQGEVAEEELSLMRENKLTV